MSMKFKSDIEVQAGLRDSSGSLGASGQILSSTSGNVSWVTPTVNTVASDVQNQVKAGVAINKGQAVYVTGADGTNIIVGLASNTSEATSSKTLGLLNATVATNGFADVVQIGRLAGLNTLGANAGDPVWLGTSGNLIYGLANKPYAPAHLVFLGIVTRVNSNNGEIFVNVQNGFELKEIHDVDIITNVPINGDVLGYDGTLWVNKTIAEWLGYTPANASGTTNYVSKFTGTTSLGNSQIYDNGTNVGIGTTSPNQKLALVGANTTPTLAGNEGTFSVLQGAADYGIVMGTKSSGNGWVQAKRVDGAAAAYNLELQPLGGNVGIGTTSPSGKLHVAGVDQLLDDGTNGRITLEINTGQNDIYSTTTAFGAWKNLRYSANDHYFRNGGTEVMRLTGGNVGIGTTNPLNKFVVSNNNYNGLEFIPDNGSGMSQIFSFNRTLSAWSDFALYSSNLIFNTNGSNERMRITSSGNVGIGTTTANYRTQIETTGADVFLTKNTSSTSFNRSYFYNNNNVGVQFLNFGSAYGFGTEFGVGQNGSVIQSNTTSAFAVGTSGAYPLLLGTNGTERMRILSGGNVGIGTTSPAYKTDIVGNLRFSTGYLNSDNCFERVFSDAIVFANGTANLAADVILGNSNFWGYIEVEVTSTFNNQSSPGKLTKIFAAGVTPNNNIYANESRVSDAMGPVPNNVAIGDLSWDATNSRYRIPISHIVSTGNTYTVKVRMFTANASSSTGAKGVFDSISIGSTYTLTALSRQYPYYNNKLSIGTSSASAVLTLQNESGAYGTSYPFKMLSYAGTNIFRSYMDGNWNYVNEVFQIGGNSCGYIISTNSSERMRITSSGNVGIGTTSPSQKLSIVGGSSTYAQVNNGSNSIYLGQISSYGLIQSDLDLALLSGGSERMRITSAGNVGIGTTSPGAKLDVNGDALINGLTVGRGPGNSAFNTALGVAALNSNTSGEYNIAIGRSANYAVNISGSTVIGADLFTNPGNNSLASNCLAISQYNPNNAGTQYPHIYAPDKVNCPNGNTITNIIAVDYSIYTAIFMEYSIFNSAGDQFRAGTYTVAFKSTGTAVDDDNQTVVYSGTTLAATFGVDYSGSVAIIQLRNQDSDTYDVRVTARLLMR